MSLLSRLFRAGRAPPKTVDDHLADIEARLLEELTQIGEPGSNEVWTKEEINTQLLSLEKIGDIRGRRKSFLHTPAGASILTAVVAITATQIPAVTQMYVSGRAEESKRLTPVFEQIAKDDKLNLDEKLAVIDFVSHGRDPYETVEEYLERYRSQKIDRANERKHSTESTNRDSSTEQAIPNNQLNKDASR